jgi:DNA-binding NarL/FixJ family response regulator
MVPLVEDLAPPQPPTGGILARHCERYRQVEALVARGLTITAVANTLHLDRKNVRKFAHAASAEAVGTWQLRPPLP